MDAISIACAMPFIQVGYLFILLILVVSSPQSDKIGGKTLKSGEALEGQKHVERISSKMELKPMLPL